MTDVTGFGLAGHLLEILDASGVAAELDLAALPLLPGAEALAALGQGSSLAPANRAAALGRLRAPQGPRTDLLFDPQTGGGLLAALPADQADEALAALERKGLAAAFIGRIVPGPPGILAR
jgi:selenide,water dikinase